MKDPHGRPQSAARGPSAARSPAPERTSFFAACLLGAVSCVGVVEEGEEGGGGGGSGVLDPASRPRAPLRRLSHAQYNNTIRDLLGDTSRPAEAFLEEDQPGSFAGLALSAQAAPALIDQYRKTAELLAAAAVKNLGTLLPCQPQAATEEACARTFIDDFGARAFRRPLAPEESAGLLDVYRQVRAQGDFVLAIQAIVATALQSPSFLYRVEVPPAGSAPGTVVALGPYEVAARLSYFLWNTMPDRELFAAAKSGKLATPVGIGAQVERMLRHPYARESATEFFNQWLELEKITTTSKDPKIYPEFTDTLRTAMQEETRLFATWVMFDSDGTFETLLTSPKSYINSGLAKLYGATAGSAFGLADLNPTERSGLLTQASVLSLTSRRDATSPTLRGKFVLDHLVCQRPPPPPPDVKFELPAPKPGQTARERVAEHTKNPTCAACHAFMDPVGLGFESYDAIGKYRPTDGGRPVDASGNVSNTRDLDGPFVGVTELSRKLVASAQARECMVKQWFTFANGRPPEDAGDQGSMRAALASFTAGASVRDLLLALTKTDSFRTRLVEVAP